MIRAIIILTAGIAFILMSPVVAQTTAPMKQQHLGHSFDDAEKWAKVFDDPQRDALQKPDEVLDALRLQGTDKVADIGAGTGYFSVRIAKRVLEGKVFAVDIEPDMLRYLGERAHREHLSVLVPVRATADSSNIPELVDVVLVVDTYHHIDNRVSYFAKLRDSLVPNGRVAIIDFKLDAPEGPPPGKNRHGTRRRWVFVGRDPHILAEAIFSRVSAKGVVTEHVRSAPTFARIAKSNRRGEPDREAVAVMIK